MKFLFALIAIMSMQPGFAQKQRFVEKPQHQNPYTQGRSAAYLGIATGINSYSGLLGFEAEIPIQDRISLFGVAGLGFWGYKLGGGAQFYLQKPQFGSSLSIGYTVALGSSEALEIESTDNSGNDVTYHIRLNPASTVNLIYHYNFRVGRGNKIGLGGGWAIPLETQPYDIVSSSNGSTQLGQTEQLAMRIVQPGGFVFSFKFLFGVN